MHHPTEVTEAPVVATGVVDVVDVYVVEMEVEVVVVVLAY